MDPTALLAVAVSLVGIYVVLRLLALPFRLLVEFLGRVLLGAALIWGFNVLGQKLGVRLPLNPITAGIVGHLGVAGLAALLSITLVLF